MANATSITRRHSVFGLPCAKLPQYVRAIRLESLGTSVLPTLLGCIVAQKLNSDMEFSLLTRLLTLLTVALVHGAGNVVNTYYDHVRGIDGRNSDDRTLVDNILSKDEVKRLSAVLYIFSFVSFLWLAIMSPAKIGHLAALYSLGLSMSFLYTGGFGFKYIALGDLIFFILGLASMLFAYLAHTGQPDFEPIFYALPLAFNTVAILHSNNIKNLEINKNAGIYTLAILIGETASIVVYGILLFAPYGMFYVLSLKCSRFFALPLITMNYAYKIERELRAGIDIKSLPKRTAKLNFLFGILYILAIMVVNKSNLPLY